MGAGTGTLSVIISGTPNDFGLVTIGADGSADQTIGTSTDLSLPAGPYTVAGERIAQSGMLVRVGFQPTVSLPSPCVKEGETTVVSVVYAVIPSSNKLWVGNSTAGKAMVGFASSTLGVSGTPAASVAADTVGSDGFTFDAAGNLWVLDATAGAVPLARYRASTLGTSGAKTPDIKIDSPSFGDGVPGAKVLAFDDAGNLWVSVVAASKVVMFTASQLRATGTPTATVEEMGINAPAGLAFDAAGNLFVASNGDGTVLRIDAPHLTVSGTGADLTITAMTPSPVIGPLPAPAGLAFDGAGNLWVNYDGTIAQLTPTDIAGTGPKTLTPTIQIQSDVLSLPAGIAFDEGGGLWVANSVGQFGRFGPTQLTASGNIAPEVVITSPDVSYAGWFAIYPAPASTPLAHRLP